jgi:acetyl-CoA acetyltransferase
MFENAAENTSQGMETQLKYLKSGAQFRKVYSAEEVASSPMIHWSLTKLQCCLMSNGAAAAILVSKTFLNKHGSLWEQAVEVAGQLKVPARRW